jgi:hypothetical protein
MQKEIFIINGKSGESYTDFGFRMLEMAGNLMDRYGPECLKLVLTARKPPLFSVIPFRKDKVAVWSVVGVSDKMRESLSGIEGFRGGYLVEEAVPVAYDRSWKDGIPTPGICLLTFFHKKPGLSQDQFIKRWHDGHTPLSLKLHPLWNYNRNVVQNTSVEDVPWYDGIVEEQFRTPSDLLNPFIFFGPPIKVPKHMMQVLRDTKSFIDMKRIETYLATEYILKS